MKKPIQTYQQPSARILFGALNSSPLLNHHDNFFLSSHPNITIETRSLLEQYIEPTYELYYIGPAGGYGENLRKRITDYHINAEGMRLIVELRGKKDIPIIHTQDAFQIFMSDTPMFTRAVAILDYEKVMLGSKHDSSEYMAILCEKGQDSDAVYFYSSKEETFLDMVDASVYETYFNKTTHLCFPNEGRTDFCDFDSHPTFAAEDAIRLCSLDRTPLRLKKNEPSFFFSTDEASSSKVRSCTFKLDTVFKYSIEEVSKDDMNRIIRHLEESGLEPPKDGVSLLR